MRQRISIYQVLPRLFGNVTTTNQKNGSYSVNGSGKLSDFTSERLRAIRDLGSTHIWYIGIIEHATKTAFGTKIPANHSAIVKGEAGSPYAIRDYYDIAPALATDINQRMAEFELLIERTHNEGLGVIIDFVPNHLSRAYASDAKPPYINDFGKNDNTQVDFDPNNNFYYLTGQTLTIPFGDNREDIPYSEYPAKATGNNRFTSHPTREDWYETVKLNYGIDLQNDWKTYYTPIPDTWHKMLNILTFWASKGIEGFRCDMAELVPLEFWVWAIGQLRKTYPHILFVAEIYNPNRYKDFIKAGFDYLYDKVGLYDTLVKVLNGTTDTKAINYVLQSQEEYKNHLIRFMENHDEQRLASDFICGDGIKAFPAMCLSILIDGSPFMTLFGQELGERGMDEEGFSGLDGKTSIFDYWSLASIRNWLTDPSFNSPLRAQYQWVQNLALTPLFTTGLFYNLTYLNPNYSKEGLFLFLRALPNEYALVVINFKEKAQTLEIPLPKHAFDTLQIPEDKTLLVTDLKDHTQTYATLTPEAPYRLKATGYGATIHHFLLE